MAKLELMAKAKIEPGGYFFYCTYADNNKTMGYASHVTRKLLVASNYQPKNSFVELMRGAKASAMNWKAKAECLTRW